MLRSQESSAQEQAWIRKTPAALRGLILVGGKFRQGFIEVYFLMGLKAPISAAFGPLALMD
jgi:hypothetical protein